MGAARVLGTNAFSSMSGTPSADQAVAVPSGIAQSSQCHHLHLHHRVCQCIAQFRRGGNAVLMRAAHQKATGAFARMNGIASAGHHAPVSGSVQARVQRVLLVLPHWLWGWLGLAS